MLLLFKIYFHATYFFTDGTSSSVEHAETIELYILEIRHYCQAQPQFKVSWAELALFLIPPAARPAGHPPAGLVVNSQEISRKSA